MKNPLTPAGIEPATYRFVAQHLNHCATVVPLSINTNANNVDLSTSIYRKPAYIDITIHFTSIHPYDHKVAAFNYYINRMFTVPIMVQAAKQEWKKILNMAHNSGFPEHIIYRLRNKLIAKNDRKTNTGHGTTQ